MRSLWEKTNLNWVWTWMAIYGGSLSVLAAYVASTAAAAAAEASEKLRIKNAESRMANITHILHSAFCILTCDC